MSRRELAQVVNEYVRATTGRAGTLSREQVWRWEHGVTRWPGKAYREALRAVLGVGSDEDLGFVQTPRTRRAMDDRASHPVDAGEQASGRRQRMFGAGRELTVRALIRSRGRALVVRDKGTGWLSLPGGPVGEGMPVQERLQQHVTRQTGLQATVVSFAGAVERHDARSEVVRHAITLMFELQTSSTATTDQDLIADTDDATVQWLPVEDLARYDVRPAALRDLVVDGADRPFWRAWTP